MTRILIIDDDPEIVMIASVCLQKAGDFEVVQSGTAEEGLRLAEAEAPDAILLDVLLEDSDGPTLLAGLRSQAKTRDIPVIFLTAKTAPDEVKGLIALGARGVIGKPFDPLRLAPEIRRLLGA